MKHSQIVSLPLLQLGCHTAGQGEGVLKLIDFGFSKHFREGKMMKSHKGVGSLWIFSGVSVESVDLFRLPCSMAPWLHGSMAPWLHGAGTLSFMAPEVLQHQWLDVSGTATENVYFTNEYKLHMGQT